MDDFVTVNGKRYRKGYTTGSCAVAASKASLMMLLGGTVVDTVEIDTPAGIRLRLPVSRVEFTEGSVKCAVVKDGGDDPDVTTGLYVFSEVRLTDKPGVTVGAGEGIGIVKLPGLKVPVGKPAINPVPLMMIEKEIKPLLPEGKGVYIVLSVPGGQETSKMTYNKKLGIEGGISILGTTGIVLPMSEEAWKESLALELGIMAAKGFKDAVFIFGNYGESFTSGVLKINSDRVVKVSNFIGFMLDKAMEYGFERVLLAGHAGKLVKVSAGIFQTHSRVADARMEVIAAYAALEGASKETVENIYRCKTSESAFEIINNMGLNGVYKRIVLNASKRCGEYTYGRIKTGSVLFNNDNEILAADDSVGNILNSLERV
jgi:cobalt-precorrin-5B (C1)-methyltransferase